MRRPIAQSMMDERTGVNKELQSEWFAFHDDLSEDLEEFFNMGGTVEMLDGNEEGGALANCIEEIAEKSYEVMMNHGAKPSSKTWRLVLQYANQRTEYVEDFLKRGFLPKKDDIVFADDPQKDLISSCLCRKSVLYVLYIGKNSKQPMFHIWKIVAKFLYETKNDHIWLTCLPV